MPGESMTIDVSTYPEFQEKGVGDKISFTVTGEIVAFDDNMIEIQTEGIEVAGNPAEKELRNLRGDKPKRGRKSGSYSTDTEEEDGY